MDTPAAELEGVPAGQLWGRSLAWTLTTPPTPASSSVSPKLQLEPPMHLGITLAR